jgi:hypothetical protein
MISLIGYSKKTISKSSFLTLLLLLLFSTFFSFLTIDSVAASNNSQPISQVNRIDYNLNRLGDLEAEVSVILKNRKELPTSIRYLNIDIPFKKIDNLTVRTGAEKLRTTQHKRGNATRLIISLNERSIGSEQSLRIQLFFQVHDYFNKKPQYISIPTIYRNGPTEALSISLDSELSFNNSYVPKGYSKDTKDADTVFTSDNIAQKEITIPKYDAIEYTFDIERVFNNDDSIDKEFEISLPKTETHQILFLEKVPKSSWLNIDEEENLYLVVPVKSDESFTAKISGRIQSYNRIPENRSQLDTIFTKNQLTKLVNHWSFENELELKRIDFYLKKNSINIEKLDGNIENLETYEKRAKVYNSLYNYLLDRLAPSDLQLEGNKYRLGAEKTLEDPRNASYQDFNDLLIAYYRKYNIPTRLVQGYVTDLSKSYSGGFFHTWVEYWDEDTGWNIVDPVLEVETGIDMFNHSQNDHIVFTTRSRNSISPQLSFFNDHEFEITESKGFVAENISVQPTLSIDSISIFKPNQEVELSLTNQGNTPVQIDSITGDLSNDLDLKDYPPILPGQTVTYFLPYSSDINYTQSFSDKSLLVKIGLESLTGSKKEVFTESEIDIETYWWWEYLLKFSSIFIISTLLIVLVNLIKFIEKRYA